MTYTALAITLAARAPHDSWALGQLPRLVDAAHAELTAAGAPEAAEAVVAACVRLTAGLHGGHMSADTCPGSGHLSG